MSSYLSHLKYDKKMTMSRFYSIAVFAIIIFSSSAIFAQFPPMMGGNQGPKITGRISGTVVDSTSNAAVEFATVSIKKQGGTVETGGTLTDESGSFRLENLSPAKYEITISFLGYNDLVLKDIETTGRKPDLNLGNISLAPNALLLNEVVVSGEASLIESKVDRLVYNAEKDISIAGGDASDVLRKVPLLSVDIDGNPSLRGSSNIRVLINGKPSGTMAGNVSDALKMIPAEEIKSIEVITSPSAKYDAEGTGGIINIITKKRNVEGMNGSINAGLNTRNNSFNGNLGVRKGRLGVNGSLGANLFTRRAGFTEFRREDQIEEGLRILTQNGDFIGGRNTYNGNIGIDYDINAFNNISSNFRVNNFTFFGDNNLDVFINDPGIPLELEYRRESESSSGFTNFDWTADYRKTYTKPQKEWTFGTQISRSNNKNKYNITQFSETFPDLSLDERSDNIGHNTELTFQTDFVQPYSKGLIEIGAKTVLRNITSDFIYEVKDLLSDDYTVDNMRSNSFEYQQNVFAGYGSINYRFSQTLEAKTGVRWEMTDISGSFQSGELSIANQFHNFVPNFTLSKTLKNFRTLKFSYSQRIQRPSLFFLNPFENAADPRNVTVGNPNLGAEVSDQVEVGFNGFFKGTVLNASLYYRYTKDVIQSFITIREDGVSVNSFDNIGYNNTAGVNLFGQVVLFSKLTIRGSFNGMYVIQNGIINNERLENKDFQYNIFSNATYQFDGGWSAEMFGVFNSQRVTLQGRNPAFSIYNFSVKKTFWDKKASLGLNFTNPFTPFLTFRQDLEGPTFFQYNENGIPFRAIGINFSWQFGKVEFKNPLQKKKGVGNEDLKQGDGIGF
jgi:ferric enterobactin receptor